VTAPEILHHKATHGFFLNDIEALTRPSKLQHVQITAELLQE
jgi:hypothetical protein